VGFSLNLSPHTEYPGHVLREAMEYADAVEQSNLVLTAITSGLHLMFFVAATSTKEVLYSNYAATSLFSSSAKFLRQVLSLPVKSVMEFQFPFGEAVHYYTITTYPILWEDLQSTAYLLNDVTAEKFSSKKTFAYQDSLTGLDNRLAGIMTLNKWLDLRREFIVCLANLDNIKYINNMYGRGEGDLCIQCVAEHLSASLQDARLCKMRGDEFLILIPGLNRSAAEERMGQICDDIKRDVEDRHYFCNISYGMVEVDAYNARNASELLAYADERMHESKNNSKRFRLLDIDQTSLEES
jgi:diguanylate cyclase (GGDEF)-like protein